MRQQLNEERQNVRRVTLQREVETKELRNTIDNQVCFSVGLLPRRVSNKL